MPATDTTDQRRLPAEWERQGAVLLAWPGADSDWAPYLARARATVVAMAAAISHRAKALIIADDPASARAALATANVSATVIGVPLNDTWVRDFGPITVLEGQVPVLLDFGFNGWGLKFPADRDNQATARMHAAGHLGRARREVPGLWFEGGSIESDGAGTILTTSSCLLSLNRNPHLHRTDIEREMIRHLGAKRVLWLDHGHLEGDDTDAHIDTLARLCPDNVIVYQRCDDPTDSHASDLSRMEIELRALRTADGKPYRLVPLPWPTPRYGDDGHRLPATYANFLFINGVVLVPTYADPPRDSAALAAVAAACPGWTVEGIDCTVLVEQHGSLHCMTMQIPEEVFTWKA
ncbi:MAG: agmatine deiminase family protein [Planctomycetota bacterium]